MKDTLDLILLIALVIGLIFLFSGEPDVFDLLREAAIARLKGTS